MAKKEIYLKLGEKAPAFADINSGVILSGKKVIKVTNAQLVAPKVARAILGGHLAKADVDEYEEWKKLEALTRSESGIVDPAKELMDLKKENEILKKKLKELESEEDNPPSKFAKMKDAALLKYYKDEYEVMEEDIEKFKALELSEKVKFLEELETQ